MCRSPRARAGTAPLLVAALVMAVALAPPAVIPASAATRPTVKLRITVDDGRGHSSVARLSCRGTVSSARGYLRRRAATACRQARRVASLLRSGPSEGICTQIYGGPQTARVRGEIGGRGVNRRFARTNGCEIDEWDRAGVLLPRSNFNP